MRIDWGWPHSRPFSFAQRWRVAGARVRGDDWTGGMPDAVTGQRRARHGYPPAMEPQSRHPQPPARGFVPIILGSYVREGMYTSCVFHPGEEAPTPLPGVFTASFMRPFQLLKWAH